MNYRKKRIPFANPFISEEEAKRVYEAVSKQMLRYGENISLFENIVAKYVGVKYAIAVSSGTAALHTALLALNIRHDEIIMPSFTCAPPAI